MFVGSSVTNVLSYSAEINSSCWSSTTNGRKTGSTYWKWIQNWYQCKYWHRWWQHNNKQTLADKHFYWSTLLMTNIEKRVHFHVCAFYSRTRLHHRGKLGMTGRVDGRRRFGGRDVWIQPLPQSKRATEEYDSVCVPIFLSVFYLIV